MVDGEETRGGEGEKRVCGGKGEENLLKENKNDEEKKVNKEKQTDEW